MSNKNNFQNVELKNNSPEENIDNKSNFFYEKNSGIIKDISNENNYKQNIDEKIHNDNLINNEIIVENEIITNPPKEEKKEITPTSTGIVDSIINDVGITWYHMRIYIILSLFFLADGAEMIVISLLIKQLGRLWNLTNTEMGFTGSVVFVGFFVGALISGKMSDTQGRKPVFVAGAIIVCIFSIASSLATSFSMFLILRGLNGFGIGISIPSSSSLAAEITPTKYRSWVLNLVWIFFPFGEIFATIIAREVLPLENGWRYLLAFAALPTIISAILSFFIYESPRFYLTVKNYDKAFQGMERILLSKKNVDICIDIQMKNNNLNNLELEISNNEKKEKELTNEKHDYLELNKKLNNFLNYENKLNEDTKKLIISQNENEKQIKPEFRTLLKKEYLYLTFLCCFIFFVCSFVYYGLIYILPQTIGQITPKNSIIIGNNTLLNNSNLTDKNNNEDEMYKGVILSALSEIPSTFLAGYIGNIPLLGRKGSMLYGFILSGISSILCAVFINDLSIYATALKFSIDIPFGIIYLYVSEAYPTMIRTISIGVTNSFNRLGGISTPIISQIAFADQPNNPYKIYAFACFLAAGATYLLPFETLGRNIS